MHGATILGCDVDNLAPGGTVTLDASSALFPIAHLRQLRSDTYAVQALLHTNPDLNVPNAPSDLYSKVKTVRLDPVAGRTVALELAEAVPEETLPADTELVKYLKLRSKILSDFHGRPIYLRAGVILPRDFAREPTRRYPLRVHIGGYGGRFTGVGHRMASGTDFHRIWMANDGWPMTHRE
jgi:hypothetical protein